MGAHAANMTPPSRSGSVEKIETRPIRPTRRKGCRLPGIDLWAGTSGSVGACVATLKN